MSKTKRIVSVKVLPGEPLDGSGRVCIHLFVQEESGAFVTPCAVHPVIVDGAQVKQQVTCGPARGRLACDSSHDPTPSTRNGVTTVTLRTDDPQAVTCLKCIASESYREMVKKHERVKAVVPGTQ